METYTLESLSKLLGCEFVGEPGVKIIKINELSSAVSGDIAFLANKAYLKYLPECKASAVIISPDMLDSCQTNALITPNPYLTYAQLSKIFSNRPIVKAGIHASAIVETSATVHPSAHIGAHVVIGENVKIGANTIIYPNTVIGNDVVIGEHVQLFANVSVYYGCQIGNHVVVHSGAVIGSDGFGFAPNPEGWCKIEQLGAVIIDDHVEIGASTTIDRGAIDNTVISKGVKIDNQVQIAHNVFIDEYTAIAGCTAIAGSTKIGKWCMIGGCAAVGGHLTITDKVTVTGQSAITHSIINSGVYSSSIQAQEHSKWKRTHGRIQQLDKLVKKVKILEKWYKKEN